MTTQKPYLNTNEFLEMSEMLTSSNLYPANPTQEYDIYANVSLANYDWLWWLQDYLTNRSTAVYSRTALQTSGMSLIHWDNLTHVPLLANSTWKGPIDTAANLYTIVGSNGDTYFVEDSDYLARWNDSTNSWEIINNTYFAQLDSPTFTGIPTAPTASLGTATTQIATTAFVASTLAGNTAWIRDGGTNTVIPTTPTDYVNLGSGIKDIITHIPIPFSESDNTSLAPHFTASSVIGAINELIGSTNIVDIRNYNTLGDALIAIGNTEATLFIPEEYVLDDDYDIPYNVTLWFTNGGFITIDEYFLSIAGPVIAPPIHIFNIGDIEEGGGEEGGMGGVEFITFPQPENIKKSKNTTECIYVEWFGAIGDGYTDDSMAIQYALNVAYNSGLLIKATGTYFMNNGIQIQDQDVDFEKATFIYDDGLYQFDGINWDTWTFWTDGTSYNYGDYALSSVDLLYYKCIAGGTSNGNDSNLAGGSDTGCTWEEAVIYPFGETAITLYNDDTINGKNIIAHRTIKLPKIWKYTNSFGPGIWDGQGIAVNAINLNSCNVYFQYIRNFETGIIIQGTDNTGNVYNNYYMNEIANCKISLHLTSEYGGWSNENNYYGGRFTIWTGERTYALNNITASSGDTYTITKSGAGWTVDAYKGMVINITQGTGAGQTRVISGNTSDTITILNTWEWTIQPDATSVFKVWGTIPGTKSIYLEHTADNYPNNNVFYKPCFESNEFEYVIDCGGRQNQFIQPRYEGYMMNVNLPYDARQNYFNGGYGLNSYGFKFTPPAEHENTSRTIVMTTEGDTIFNEPLKLGHRNLGQNMFAVLPSTIETLTADISTDYAFAVSDTFVHSKGTTHTYDSIKLDIEQGRLYFGTGANEATNYIDFSGGNMISSASIHAFLLM